mmetsp:Transcript_16640/g.18496  ORF Transcript_16640/g.18496 Transcript_16640/m.18496 type:complete len:277 (+) Transcript_16640:36-866(+)
MGKGWGRREERLLLVVLLAKDASVLCEQVVVDVLVGAVLTTGPAPVRTTCARHVVAASVLLRLHLASRALLGHHYRASGARGLRKGLGNPPLLGSPAALLTVPVVHLGHRASATLDGHQRLHLVASCAPSVEHCGVPRRQRLVAVDGTHGPVEALERGARRLALAEGACEVGGQHQLARRRLPVPGAEAVRAHRGIALATCALQGVDGAVGVAEAAQALEAAREELATHLLHELCGVEDGLHVQVEHSRRRLLNLLLGLLLCKDLGEPRVELEEAS